MALALTVGGSVLNAFLAVLFDRMAKPEFLNLFRKQKFDDSILEKLKGKLLPLKDVLEDAENKQTKSDAVKVWLDQLQDVLYQADDLLDEINTEALRMEVETKYQSPATNLVSASSNPSNFNNEFLKEIKPKLEEIVQKLDDCEKKIGTLRLVEGVEPRKPPFRRPSTSLVENDECGRDVETTEIIEDLLSEDGNGRNFTVISIVGLPGVGKTTLAKLVYNDESLDKQFDQKAWVCISEEYDVMRITKSLLNELKIPCSDPSETFNSLQLKLKEGLSNQKFLLVLDDMWNRDYNDWLELSRPFNGGKEGSKIIVTTRDETIAKHLGNQHIHHLNPMTEEDCWSLFKKHALNIKDDSGNLKFELIGKDIVKKCGGLPLAVKAIAGLLRSKQTTEQWDEILRSDEWEESSNQSGILPSLRLSYTHLSPHLKRCFGYCAVFPKNYQFSKNEVILLWMANDLLLQRNKRLEDVGDELFRDLRLRSLFQQTSDGKFLMHDLVNDLAKFVSGKYFLRLENDWQKNGSLIVARARHFSYIRTGDSDIFEKFKPLKQLKFLRTFLPIDFNQNGCAYWNSLLQDILPTSKSIRVLSLYGLDIFELPSLLSDLKQLRFLNLSNTSITKLPSWICTFYNLQSLLLVDCKRLEEFPKDMEKLVNLRYLDMSGVPLIKMPLDIGRLQGIQFLSTFVVSTDNGSSIEKLGKLCNLRGEFTISGLENIPSGKNATKAKMKDKKFIQKLTLEWKGDSNYSQDVLENLQPNTNIKHVAIRGYCGKRFSEWLQDTSFCHMRNLHISKCKNCICLPAIGQLPSLKHLTISDLSNVLRIDQAIHGSRKLFPCLEELYIEDCPQLKEGIPKQIPSLKKMNSFGCPRLVNLNGELGIFDSKADFSSLAELEIGRMPKLSSDYFSLQVIGQLPLSLKRLLISGLSELVKMSPAICGSGKLFHCLEELHLEDCPLLKNEGIPKQIPSLKKIVISQCPRLVKSDGKLVVFDSQTDFSSLVELQIREMPNLNSSNLVLDKLLPCLEVLDISSCEGIISFNRLPNTLKQINFSNCGNLELELETCVLTQTCDVSLASMKKLSLSLSPALQDLRVKNVEDLSFSIPQGNQNLTSLRKLIIGGCDNFVLFPVGGLDAPCLTDIWLEDCPELKSLPERMHTLLPSLQSLYIIDCPEIEHFPEGGLPSSLESLSIDGCERLWSCCGQWGLQTLPSLTGLTLRGVHQQEVLLSEDLLLPPTLTSLYLGENNNAKTLGVCGVLQHLTSLQSLQICYCPELRSLPGGWLPASLSRLEISDCPLLKQHLEWKKGKDWPKVAHIPVIVVDSELIH